MTFSENKRRNFMNGSDYSHMAAADLGFPRGARTYYLDITGADPGFPVGGGASPPGGAPTYDFAKFSEKLHEIEKIFGRGGWVRRVCPPKSATA